MREEGNNKLVMLRGECGGSKRVVGDERKLMKAKVKLKNGDPAIVASNELGRGTLKQFWDVTDSAEVDRK